MMLNQNVCTHTMRNVKCSCSALKLVYRVYIGFRVNNIQVQYLVKPITLTFINKVTINVRVMTNIMMLAD